MEGIKTESRLPVIYVNFFSTIYVCLIRKIKRDKINIYYFSFSLNSITHDSHVMASSETSDSHVRCVPSPPNIRLTIADLFDNQTGGGKPKIDRLREHLLAEGRLEEDAALMIIERGEALLRAENNLIDVEAPITGTINKIFKNQPFLCISLW